MMQDTKTMTEEQLGYWRRIVNAAAARNMPVEEFVKVSKYAQKLLKLMDEAVR